MFKIGDEVECIQHHYDSISNYTIGKIYRVGSINNVDNQYNSRTISVPGDGHPEWLVSPRCFKLAKEKNMLDSVKEYLKQHKDIIITIGVVLVVDHLIFGGAFREKVKALVDGLLNKAEKQLSEK